MFYSQIDILVNNAAKAIFMKIKDTPIEVDKEIIDLVVVAQVSLTKAVLPQFLKQQSGHVVVTSSLAGKMGKYINKRIILNTLHNLNPGIGIHFIQSHLWGEVSICALCCNYSQLF